MAIMTLRVLLRNAGKACHLHTIPTVKVQLFPQACPCAKSPTHLGNCDNHLKNFAVLYDESMSHAALSPAYDILDTTIYARVATEMGVSLSSSRSILGVKKEDLVQAIRHAGYPEELALGEFESVRDDVLRCFPKACEIVASQGFAEEVERLSGPMEQGLKARASFTYSERDRLYLDTRGLGAGERK